MKAVVDIPDKVYRELELRSLRAGSSVEELILSAITSSVTPAPTVSVNPRRLALPLISEGVPGSLDLDNEKIYDLIGFP